MSCTVRLLHMSDTHGMHNMLRSEDLPRADALLHTGDFTDRGGAEEFASFNAWLHSVRHLYGDVLLILGNHEWLCSKEERGRRLSDPSLIPRMLDAATVLDHEGRCVGPSGLLNVWGSPWIPGNKASAPGDGGAEHRFTDIPRGTHVLMTHGPPFGVLDRLESSSHHWGGSSSLRKEMRRSRPLAHLFGHVHEQRGFWWRSNESSPFLGGVQYSPHAGASWATFPPPQYTDPCLLYACTAMSNHCGLEGSKYKRLAGLPRLIDATTTDGGSTWCFSLPGDDMSTCGPVLQ